MIFDRLLSRRPPRVGPVSPRHAAALAEIHAEAFARPWEAHDIERMILDPAIVSDGIFLGNGRDPVGFALSRIVLDEAEVLTLVIARRAQGRGLGRALMSAHLARIAARGVRAIFLEVEDGNIPATALYHSFGFVETGRREGYYVKLDGRRVAAHVMRLSLL